MRGGPEAEHAEKGRSLGGGGGPTRNRQVRVGWMGHTAEAEPGAELGRGLIENVLWAGPELWAGLRTGHRQRGETSGERLSHSLQLLLQRQRAPLL